MVSKDRLLHAYPEEGAELYQLAREAEEFLLAHKWCQAVHQIYFAYGFAKVAVFLAEIEPAMSADPKVFVVVGDIPPAYLDLEECPDAKEALEAYVFLCREWVDAVLAGQSTEELMPIYYKDSLRHMEETIENAKELSSRLDFIEKNILQSDIDFSA